MTENTQPALPIEIHAQYLKDISFETPGPLGMDAGEEQPEIMLNVEVKANPTSQEDCYEVELQMSAEAKAADKRVFLLEINYAGLFALKGLEKESVTPVLMIECPRLLFPFARAIIANATREGGFPPLAIAPIDFAGIYRAQLERTDGGAKTA